jgi:hypothetical protein
MFCVGIFLRSDEPDGAVLNAGSSYVWVNMVCITVSNKLILNSFILKLQFWMENQITIVLNGVTFLGNIISVSFKEVVLDPDQMKFA